MAKKGMTYEELRLFAAQHYESGGDVIYECWEKSDYEEYVDLFGPITKTKAKCLFKQRQDQWNEIQATVF